MFESSVVPSNSIVLFSTICTVSFFIVCVPETTKLPSIVIVSSLSPIVSALLAKPPPNAVFKKGLKLAGETVCGSPVPEEYLPITDSVGISLNFAYEIAPLSIFTVVTAPVPKAVVSTDPGA